MKSDSSSLRRLAPLPEPVRARLVAAIEAAGSQRALAQRHGLDRDTLSAAARGAPVTATVRLCCAWLASNF